MRFRRRGDTGLRKQCENKNGSFSHSVRTLLAIHLKPFAVGDRWDSRNQFHEAAGLQPSADNLPTLRLGLRWAVFLHYQPGGSAFGGIIT
jgi:hypothetical protein